MNPTFGLAAITVIVAAVSAQSGSVVLPGSAAAGEAPAMTLGPFVTASFRWQQVWPGSAIAETGATIASINWRRDNGLASQGIAFSARTFANVSIALATTSVLPGTMSPAFGSNLTGPSTTVFSGSLSLPPQAPFNFAFDIRLPVRAPVALQLTGTNLLLDLSCTGGPAPNGDYNLDAADVFGISGNSVQPFGMSGPFSNGDSVSYHATRFVELSFPNQQPNLVLAASGMSAGHSTIAMFGRSELQHGPYPLPFPLAFFGAPNNCLYVSVDVCRRMSVFQDRPGEFLAELAVRVPNTPGLAGTQLLTQAMMLDPASNALGIVTTNAVRFTLGSTTGPLTQAVVAPDATSPTGVFALASGSGGPVTELLGQFF